MSRGLLGFLASIASTRGEREPRYGPWRPLAPAAVAAQNRHERAVDELVPMLDNADREHDKWCAELHRLRKLRDAEIAQWRAEMVAAMPELAEYGFHISPDNTEVRMELSDPAPAAPGPARPAPPEWVADVLRDLEKPGGE